MARHSTSERRPSSPSATGDRQAGGRRPWPTCFRRAVGGPRPAASDAGCVQGGGPGGEPPPLLICAARRRNARRLRDAEKQPRRRRPRRPAAPHRRRDGGRSRLRERPALAVPPHARRRGPGPQPAPAALLDLLAGGRDDLYLVGDAAQSIYGFNGSDPTLLLDVERRLPASRWYGCRPTTVARRRSSPPAGTCSAERAARRAALGPTRRPVVSDRRRRRRAGRSGRWWRARSRRSDPSPAPGSRVAVLARTNAQLARVDRALAAIGVPVRPNGSCRGSAVAAAVERRAYCPRRRPICAPGRTTRSRPRRSRRRRLKRVTPERQVAHAVLDFLRDQPVGDGAGVPRVARRHRPVRRVDAGRGRVADVPRRQGTRVAHGAARRVRDESRPPPLSHDHRHPRRRGAVAPCGGHPRHRRTDRQLGATTRRLQPRPQPVRRRSRRVVSTAGRAARRRPRGARRRGSDVVAGARQAPHVARPAARAADMLPGSCAPTTPWPDSPAPAGRAAELSSITGFGPLTAARRLPR